MDSHPLCKRVVLHYVNPCFVFEHASSTCRESRANSTLEREREKTDKGVREGRMEERGGKKQFPMIICYALAGR